MILAPHPSPGFAPPDRHALHALERVAGGARSRPIALESDDEIRHPVGWAPRRVLVGQVVDSAGQDLRRSAFEVKEATDLTLPRKRRALSSRAARQIVRLKPMLAPRAGAQLGHYELVRAIGSGGMGIVYEARHATLGRRVAIKVLHGHEAGDPRSDLLAKRFLREGRAAAAVKHAHVVDVFDFGVHEGTPFLVMELVDGETLARRIERDGAIRVEEAAELLLPIVSAVAELHAAGIIHRDLKPANILLARDRSGVICPKVGDFGVSRLDDGSAGLTESGVVVGTCAYMSPEQALASKGVIAHSDQYALGAILYECTTGKLPFEGETAYALTHAILNAVLAPPSAKNKALSQKFDALVLRAMARDPEARFGSIEELGEALLSFATPEVETRWADEFRPSSTRTGLASVAPVSASPIVAPSRKRRSRARTGTAAVVASLLAAGAVAWSSRVAPRRADDGVSTPLIARFPPSDTAHATAVSPAQPPSLPPALVALAVEESASVASAVPAPSPPTAKAPEVPTARPRAPRRPPGATRPETPATDNGAPILDPE
jgi:serine/threonine protein kinase